MVSTATAATVPADATSTSVTWSYSAITWTTASTCEVSSSMTTSTSSTTVNFEAARCDSIGRTGSFPWDNHPACDNKSCSSSNVIVSWEVNQEKPEGCGCTCDADISISNKITGEIGYEEQTTPYEIATYTITQECVDTLIVENVTSSESWLKIDSYNNGSVKAKWDANESTTSTKTATITFVTKLNGETCTNPKTISYTQAKDTSCQCDYIDLKPITNISSDGGNPITIATYSSTNPGCSFKDVAVTRFSLDPNTSWLKNPGSDGNGNITATVESNTTASIRSVVLTISAKTSDDKECTSFDTITSKQDPSGCKCSDFRITSEHHSTSETAINNGYNEDEEVAVFEKSSCIKYANMHISVEQGVNWISDPNFNGGNTDGTIIATIAANDRTGAQERHGRLVITYKATDGGEDCDTKYVTIYQKGVGCVCEDFKLEGDNGGDTVNITAEVGGEGVKVSYTANCTSIYTINRDSTKVTVEHDEANSIIKITGKTTGETTVTVMYNAGTKQCEKFIKLTFVCPTITISPDNATGKCSGGTVTFTHS
jgi:hypothetical protein